MRFKVRSLGGKLIVFVTLTLLICLLLFVLSSWVLLMFYSNHAAQGDALQRTQLLRRRYQENTTELIQALRLVANDERVVAVAAHPDRAQKANLQVVLAQVLAHNYLSTLAVVNRNHSILAQVEDVNSPKNITPESIPLVNQAFKGFAVTALRQIKTSDTQLMLSSASWVFDTAVPIRDTTGVVGVLLSSQPIDDMFAQKLAQQTAGNILLCISGHVLAGTEVKEAVLKQLQTQSSFCTPNKETLLDGTYRYLALASKLQTTSQLASSATLTVVDIEPLYAFNSHTSRFVLLVVGLAVIIFAFGAVFVVIITRRFFVRPLRRLQARVNALVIPDQTIQVTPAVADELSMLTRSFSLLSESLDQESQVMTEQMSNILIMSDALISTLNLEHLLGEIVSRLGHIMRSRNVSLLLYGREMLSPWAVAQWSAPVGPTTQLPITSLDIQGQRGAVTVHADPDADITMAVTTKMAALPSIQTPSSRNSGKRLAVSQTEGKEPVPYGIRRPRIPRPALRDLDMILARMVIQRQKIAYGEDIEMIYRERNEPWARLAYEAGYRSLIAVPLLLQDRPIGAFILYNDMPYQVSSRDTFLLSTAAIQASMSIQNAMLFAEVSDKNDALERANQLKSQFLANVTHELRTPLHSIISYGGLILEGFLDGELSQEQEEHVQFMVDRAEDLSHLVDDMLDLSKIEADRIEVHLEPMDLTQSLKDVIAQVKPLANNKELQLSLVVEPGLPMVMADSHRIRQIVLNLVSNAIKFTEKGSVTIECMVTKRGDMVRVAVQDSGIGISPAALGYIFEAFRQADGSTTRRFGGTGLGLTIAKKLIELQGGEVAVESVVEQGSIFSFTLPVTTPSKGRLLSYGTQKRV